jgi:hypothetical protein
MPFGTTAQSSGAPARKATTAFFRTDVEAVNLDDRDLGLTALGLAAERLAEGLLALLGEAATQLLRAFAPAASSPDVQMRAGELKARRATRSCVARLAVPSNGLYRIEMRLAHPRARAIVRA